MRKEFKPVIKKLKNGELVKINNREILENINTIAKNYSKQYQNYYYVPTLREEFNGEYAYFYKDVYSNNLIKVEPSNFDKKTSILREKVEANKLKKCLYIGFKVPYYE